MEQQRFSHVVLKRQLLKLQSVATASTTSAARQAIFHGASLTPLTGAFVRKLGSPRHTWAEKLLEMATTIFGSSCEMDKALQNRKAWAQTVTERRLYIEFLFSQLLMI